MATIVLILGGWTAVALVVGLLFGRAASGCPRGGENSPGLVCTVGMSTRREDAVLLDGRSAEVRPPTTGGRATTALR